MADNADHPQFDLTYPSLARVYDYFLGGSHNNSRDRQLAADLESAWPRLPEIVRAQRRFLQLAVERMLTLGVRQFVDLGAGVPTAGHVHEVAHALDPASVVIYVDNDPATVAQSKIILRGDPCATAVLADFRRPTETLGHEEIRRRIDHRRPIGVTMVGIFEHITDSDDPASLIAAYRTASTVTTYLAIALVTKDAAPESDPELASAAKIYGTRLVTRSRATLKQWLGSMRVVGPGTATRGEHGAIEYVIAR